jgi:hypothetical protein
MLFDVGHGVHRITSCSSTVLYGLVHYRKHVKNNLDRTVRSCFGAIYWGEASFEGADCGSRIARILRWRATRSRQSGRCLEAAALARGVARTHIF